MRPQEVPQHLVDAAVAAKACDEPTARRVLAAVIPAQQQAVPEAIAGALAWVLWPMPTASGYMGRLIRYGVQSEMTKAVRELIAPAAAEWSLGVRSVAAAKLNRAIHQLASSRADPRLLPWEIRDLIGSTLLNPRWKDPRP